jgi:hypothetical protein
MIALVLFACGTDIPPPVVAPAAPEAPVAETPPPAEKPDRMTGLAGETFTRPADAERNFLCTSDAGNLYALPDRITVTLGGEGSAMEERVFEGLEDADSTLRADGLVVTFENHYGCYRNVKAVLDDTTLTFPTCKGHPAVCFHQD